jgi:hypothetical protein
VDYLLAVGAIMSCGEDWLVIRVGLGDFLWRRLRDLISLTT